MFLSPAMRRDLFLCGIAGRQQVPGGDGYASNPEKVTPSWTPPTDFNDGFDEVGSTVLAEIHTVV